jgi:hypothetical protein
MLRLDWNALRAGDRVLVHHGSDGGDVHLVAGVVTAVASAAGSNDVTVRVSTLSGQQVIRPPRLSVHHDPIGFDGHCWRCAALVPPATTTKRRSA